MEFGMNSMYVNKVWTLIDLLDRVKSIGYKWIYKKKVDMTSMHKAMLITKGYKQR